MKALKTILSALVVILLCTSLNAQTLEGKWMGYDSGGNLLRVEFRNDFSCFFSINNNVVHTIDYEPYYNFNPHRVVINYIPITANKAAVRIKAGIFEYLTPNKMKFQFMESDGTIFPTSFQGCYLLNSVTSFDIHQSIFPDL